MNLSSYAEALSILGDESRLRLCALLKERELCVSDLVSVTGIAQSRVSTHLGRLRDAGLVRDRRHATQCFYTLALDALPNGTRTLIEEACTGDDVTLEGDRKRLAELDAARRVGSDESSSDDLERYYSPGRTWQSLAIAMAALLDLGDVLDVGSGDGAAAAVFAPYCRSLTCVDNNPSRVEVAARRMQAYPHARAQAADAHQLPFADASFDVVLVLHTLTYTEHPARALRECARVLRAGGKLVILCLDQHQHHAVTERHGELHAGFSPNAVRKLLTGAGLKVLTADIACREARKPHFRVVMAVAQKASNTTPRRSQSRDH